MKKFKKESLVDKAYLSIKEKILTLKYKPGEQLEEKFLISDIGVGRTPIREALRMLISQGLVTNSGRNSFYVKDLSLKTCKDLMSFLLYFGNVIFELASTTDDFTSEIAELEKLKHLIDQDMEKREYLELIKHNRLFHRVLGRIARNHYVDEIIEKLYNEEMRLAFTLYEGLSSPREHHEKITSHHSELIELLKKRDFEGLKASYQNHLRYGRQRVLNYLFDASLSLKNSH
jgi:GntR family transcriptional regulator, rspAB operon transcriptional repressor